MGYLKFKLLTLKHFKIFPQDLVIEAVGNLTSILKETSKSVDDVIVLFDAGATVLQLIGNAFGAASVMATNSTNSTATVKILSDFVLWEGDFYGGPLTP